MFTKTVQFEDLEGNTVQETFYFHFNQLEIAEMLELDQLEEKVNELTKNAEEKGMSDLENTRQAYETFRELILKAHGEKTADNRSFVKTAETRAKFESSLAFPEIIFEFLKNPSLGAEFIEKCLPAKVVAAAKAEQAKNPTDDQVREMVQEAARRQENPETAVLPTAPPTLEPETKKFEDYSREELLTMPEDEFKALLPPKGQMTQQMLLIAFERKG